MKNHDFIVFTFRDDKALNILVFLMLKSCVVDCFLGTSDPYVKVKVGSRQIYKTRIIYKTLNPEWNEKCTVPVEDPYKPVRLQVFDYDRGISDDSMGMVDLDPSTLELNV